MTLSNWLRLVEQIAPIVLLATPAAPLAPFVAAGIKAAESVEGASGAQKLAIAKTIAGVGAEAVNAQAGVVVVDPQVLDATITNGINTVVGAANLIHAAQTSAPFVK